ncbi:hypothetical protein EJ04DRAFT_2640 [Polyplosphaeria fusca]|uniref:Uncharacterized protein n=1 Tax=Polyplosphaeria fusca TaxID=682080 RepID=A0A9P4RCY1_9PLEO|nr:hypothetical protein EJ04DRAFT_2640 [Polyplosphaeria fusca]
MQSYFDGKCRAAACTTYGKHQDKEADAASSPLRLSALCTCHRRVNILRPSPCHILARFLESPALPAVAMRSLHSVCIALLLVLVSCDDAGVSKAALSLPSTTSLSHFSWPHPYEPPLSSEPASSSFTPCSSNHSTARHNTTRTITRIFSSTALPSSFHISTYSNATWTNTTSHRSQQSTQLTITSTSTTYTATSSAAPTSLPTSTTQQSATSTRPAEPLFTDSASNLSGGGNWRWALSLGVLLAGARLGL